MSSLLSCGVHVDNRHVLLTTFSTVSILYEKGILNANNNSMTGTLPDSWDENNLIEDFEVAFNKFSGPLPESLSKAKFLKDLRVSHNQLTGSIPISYYEFENLEELYLDANQFTGELPQTPEPFYDGLQEFSIHSNEFTGRFPVDQFEGTFRISKLRKLTPFALLSHTYIRKLTSSFQFSAVVL